MRTSLVLIVCLLCLGHVGHASTFYAEGNSLGKTVLWFHGNRIDTTFDGEFDLAGQLIVEDRTHMFDSMGTGYGGGIADAASLAATLWILFETSGTTDDGVPITLRGGVYIQGEDADINTLSLGAGPGTFFLIATLQTESIRIAGTLTSTASGAFVPPDDPVTMQVEGTASFVFDGERVPSSGDLEAQFPWPSDAWPEEHLAALRASFGLLPVRVEQSDPED